MIIEAMITFCLFVAMEPMDGNSYESIQVDNQGVYLNRLTYNNAKLAHDGSFLVFSQYHVWHWDRDGRLIQKLGGRGEGPGEFMGVSEVFWDGEHYWVIDGKRLSSTVFDKNGRYLFRQPQYYRQFVRAGERMFLLDYSRLDPASPVYAQVLHEMNYAISDERLDVDFTGFSFKRISELQMKLQMNFKLVWIVPDGERLLVVDQLEPKIRIYDDAAIKAEDELSDKRPFEPGFIPIQTRGWVDPPEDGFKDFHTNRDFLVWWNSWSRINYFGEIGDDFLVAYEVPREDQPEETLQAMQRISREGRIQNGPVYVKGYFMGTRDNRAYLFYPDEDDDSFSYYVRIYQL